MLRCFHSGRHVQVGLFAIYPALGVVHTRRELADEQPTLFQLLFCFLHIDRRKILGRPVDKNGDKITARVENERQYIHPSRPMGSYSKRIRGGLILVPLCFFFLPYAIIGVRLGDKVLAWKC